MSAGEGEGRDRVGDGDGDGNDAGAGAGAGEEPGAATSSSESRDEWSGEDLEEIILPRGKPGRALLRVRGVDLMRIAMFATLLVMILVMRQPCADGVARFIGSFDQVDAGPSQAEGVRSDPRIGEFRRLTDEEIRAIFNGDAGSLLDDETGDAGAGSGR